MVSDSLSQRFTAQCLYRNGGNAQLLCDSMNVKVSRAIYSEEVATIIETFSDEEVKALPEALKYCNYINQIFMQAAEEKYKKII